MVGEEKREMEKHTTTRVSRGIKDVDVISIIFVQNTIFKIQYFSHVISLY